MREEIVNQKELIFVMTDLLCPLPNSPLEQAVLAEQNKNAELSRRRELLRASMQETSRNTKFWYRILKEVNL